MHSEVIVYRPHILVSWPVGHKLIDMLGDKLGLVHVVILQNRRDYELDKPVQDSQDVDPRPML
jgi:hypothetical protein